MPPTVGGGEFAVYVMVSVLTFSWQGKYQKALKKREKRQTFRTMKDPVSIMLKKCVVEAGVFGECT